MSLLHKCFNCQITIPTVQFTILSISRTFYNWPCFKTYRTKYPNEPLFSRLIKWDEMIFLFLVDDNINNVYRSKLFMTWPFSLVGKQWSCWRWREAIIPNRLGTLSKKQHNNTKRFFCVKLMSKTITKQTNFHENIKKQQWVNGVLKLNSFV